MHATKNCSNLAIILARYDKENLQRGKKVKSMTAQAKILPITMMLPSEKIRSICKIFYFRYCLFAAFEYQSNWCFLHIAILIVKEEKH